MSHSAQIIFSIGLNTYDLQSGSRVFPQALNMTPHKKFEMQGSGVVDLLSEHWAALVKAVGIDIAAFVVGQVNQQKELTVGAYEQHFDHDYIENELCRDLKIVVNYYD